jgi:hypothetical protein
MAVSHAIKQADGNVSRSAMSLVKMDGNSSFPIGTVMSLTVAVLDAEGGNVDASAAITLTTTAVQDQKGLMDAFIAELNDNLTGARAWHSRNTADEWVVHIQAIAGEAQDVDISTATFDNTPE